MRHLALAALLALLAGPAAASSASKKGTALKLPASALIEPKDLAARLSGQSGAPKPLVIQVGFEEAYKIGHIPGTDFAGPASRPDGLAKLRDYVKDIPRETELVVYCGCCPWKFCPNVQPAYKALKKMGFKHVKVLHLASNFGQDWTAAGNLAVPGE